jgi:23S rRNA (guanine2445-N2)-methyltransferase / 23S rRNA (guanine2069-N7)-methyltransferase
MIEKPVIFTATCPGGLEALLAEEITVFGGKVDKKAPGAVYFEGTLEAAYRACLWSRFAHRVLKPIGAFHAPDENELYRGALDIDWASLFGPEKTIFVVCKATRSPISNTHFAALKLKDAVADSFMGRFGLRPDVDTTNPDITLHLYLEEDKATVSIDLAGGSLHKRGYRLAGDKAPLKETLAAAVVSLSGWPYQDPHPPPFIDPMCGSGTLLIEAAMMFGGIAPGLWRERFGLQSWRGHNEAMWRNLREEASQKAEQAKIRRWPRIVGYDAARHAVAAAVKNIDSAGLKGFVHVERKELFHLTCPSLRAGDKPGFVISNPPYGRRLGSWDSIHFLYACLGRKMKQEFHGWQSAVLTSDETPASCFGLAPERKHHLFNGPLACLLTVFKPPPKPEIRPPLLGDISPQKPPGDFSGRIRKNLRRLAKWTKRESITCYRIYDADIPEFNVAVDIYEGRLVVQEYAPPKEIDPVRASERLRSVIRDLAGIFNVQEESITVKVRSRQKGTSQYQRISQGGKLLEVGEGDCRFLINLTDYLDTGLFLESRGIRKTLGRWAGGTRFLNLFGYTGTATVHAAIGGARHTTLVDISPVYLNWARCNLSLNGFAEENHRLVQADCLDWLKTCDDRFDLIYIHPPTFSNSRRTGTIFDLRRQHATLIHLAMRRLAPGGRTVFATSAAKFNLDISSLGGFLIEDISTITLPPDFIRSAGRYCCWEIRSAG